MQSESDQLIAECRQYVPKVVPDEEVLVYILQLFLLKQRPSTSFTCPLIEHVAQEVARRNG